MENQLVKKTQALLKENGLRKTIIREEVLGLFLKHPTALSHGEIEEQFDGRFDRVTIYRTLKSFEEKGLIHRVIDDGAVVKYAACSTGCSEHSHQDDHVHFKCVECRQTVCLHDVPVQGFNLPRGYTATEYQLLITGICEDCNA